MRELPGNAELNLYLLRDSQLRRQTLWHAAVTWIDSNRLQVIRRLLTEEGPTAPGGVRHLARRGGGGEELLRANRAAASWRACERPGESLLAASTPAQGIRLAQAQKLCPHKLGRCTDRHIQAERQKCEL